MNRPLPARLTAFAAALLFLLSGAGDVLGAHPCAHHDALAPGHAAEHASHAQHGPGAPAPAEHGGEPCSCLGSCSVAAGVLLPAAPEAAFTPPLASSTDAATPDDARLPGRLLPHLLPYPTAPPAV